MKNTFTLLSFLLIALGLQAQPTDDPGAYMTALSNAQVEMNQKFMAYMSAAAHGRRARKLEKMRTQTLESIDACRYKTVDVPLYKGDNSLRQSSIDYIKFSYNVFNDDYGKIVNLEEIAEQSFDEMEAYILLHEKTEEKMKEAFAKMDAATRAFAAKYNVTLIDGKSELGEKMEAASKLNKYNNKIFLIFFKCNYQDAAIVQAMNAKKLNDVEQGRSSLIRYATEGLQILDTLKNLNGDASLNIACKNMLLYYKKMAEKELPKVSDFYLKQENFSKMQKSFEAKSNPTQADVDAFNKGVEEVNNSVNQFNQMNNAMNKGRTEALKNWEAVQKSFNETHMPKYKA